MEREVEMFSRGEKVPMNGFVKKSVRNTVLALIGSLDDVDMDGELRIVIGPSGAPPSR